MDETPAAVRVAAVQMEPKLGRLETNLERMLDRIADAARAGARLVVFPECALSGYGFASRKKGWRTPSLSIARP